MHVAVHPKLSLMLIWTSSRAIRGCLQLSSSSSQTPCLFLKQAAALPLIAVVGRVWVLSLDVDGYGLVSRTAYPYASYMFNWR